MKVLLILLTLSFIPKAYSKPKALIIPEGRFTPLYGIEKNQIDFPIKSFMLDITPVTIIAYQEFLKENPTWNKKNINRLYADKNYLTEKKSIDYSPIVYISWFAANAYCESKLGRLPSTLEWEYVAASSDKLKNASRSQEVVDKILKWYSRPEVENEIAIVGKDKANVYGIHDLHGLIWEWTSDFNSVIMTSDNRNDGDKSKDLYCGAGSISAKTREDYAAFVRYSLRSSLMANFTLTNLGFRCAYDL